jgi:hypothetical protein
VIREHYLEGTASGTWDAKSQSAMQRYQSDNGWQSKTVPDSRALIKLGLGPNHDHLLNPESAMTSQPEPLHAEPMLEQTSNMTTQRRSKRQTSDVRLRTSDVIPQTSAFGLFNLGRVILSEAASSLAKKRRVEGPLLPRACSTSALHLATCTNELLSTSIHVASAPMNTM